MSTCAACGKGGDYLKVCTSCEQVSYCNAKCRKLNWQKHKKECRRHATDARKREIAARKKEKDESTIRSDEELFAEPPPKEDCEICLLPIPYSSGVGGVGVVYQPCCGKKLCQGCYAAANEEIKKGNIKDLCPFCRQRTPHSSKEVVMRFYKRMQLNDAQAFHALGCALLWKQAADLGSVCAHMSFLMHTWLGEM